MENSFDSNEKKVSDVFFNYYSKEDIHLLLRWYVIFWSTLLHREKKFKICSTVNLLASFAMRNPMHGEDVPVLGGH